MTILQQIGVCIIGLLITCFLFAWLDTTFNWIGGTEKEKKSSRGSIGCIIYVIWIAIFFILPK